MQHRREKYESMTRPLHTFSIVARDPATGDTGVAVQSHWFSVGSIVSWAEAGIGTVATQSFIDPAYGPRGLDLMRQGLGAEKALNALLSVDDGRAVRQVAMVDGKGRVAAHTGERCIESAGHHVGAQYSAQANMMRNDEVVPAMARGYESAEGELAERLLTALEAAQAAGGDIRGQQSAAILVVAAESTGRVWADRLVDLRVEDHGDPIRELRRLRDVHCAYKSMNDGDAAMERGDMTAALAAYGSAKERLPESPEIVFWNAFTLATNGHVGEGMPLFRKVFGEDASWVELLRRLPAAGLISEELVGEILSGVDAGG